MGRIKAKKSQPRGAWSMNWGSDIIWFREQAARLGMTQANLVRFAVREYVDRRWHVKGITHDTNSQ